MYRWHWFKRLVLELDEGRRGADPRGPAGKAPTRREPSERARQAELLALARLGRKDAA
jgi:hypothetical protein